MAILHDLTTSQIIQVMNEATDRAVPLSITVRDEHGWSNYHSRLVMIRGQHILIEPPINDECQTPQEFAPDARIGVSFKLKHYKHLFTASVVGIQNAKMGDGTGGVDMSLLTICMPGRMQRLQRRAFIRANVPANRVVRAAFWVGGQEAEPTRTTDQSPVWIGRVENLSAGGFQVSTDGTAAQMLDEGDIVGVRLSFGTAAGDTVFADAQYRHIKADDLGILMGFQFIGLDQSPRGRQALQMIITKVEQYHRCENSAAGIDDSDLKAG
jgi:c-di-GMP-binding flagellar brake protein YcgR